MLKIERAFELFAKNFALFAFKKYRDRKERKENTRKACKELTVL
jgi:hypothetical protein